DGPIVEWCINEKVALETGIGASLAGARTVVTMKHVGLNVAADPFMTLALTGVNAGLVVLSADDPGMHSSQNEQDNRRFAAFAKVPMLEPADSQEAYDFPAWAFDLSEEFDTPVLLRSTTRLSHGRGRVVPRAPVGFARRDYARDIAKYVMVPEYARERNRLALARLERLRRRAEETPLNVLEAGTADVGIIASGVAYTYAREAFPKAWFLKLGMSHPLPYQKVAKLYASVSRVFVVEELDPFIEEQVRALGLPVVGKEVIPANGELNPEIVFNALEPALMRKPPRRRRPVMPPKPVIAAARDPVDDLPVRPPVLCPGCPHRAVYAMLRRQKVAVMGDIGCYTLGALPPLLSLESCLCMGASIGLMAGMNKALGRIASVAIIGDSTFFHSGVTPLIDARYNQAPGLVIVLDNRTTAMTGHQGHPGTGLHPDRSVGPALDIEQLCQGIGVRCTTVDAFDEAAVKDVLTRELAAGDLSVLVALAPCILMDRSPREQVLVDDERCNLCGLCVDLGCPALVAGDEAVEITDDCTGCGVCMAVCARGALSLPEPPAGP
ncbi:MAG TPA: thiamine pyrophosphate-dependent enzyme, partial [Thermoleophilia bacterium]|nr:thiamine pyrophosphate-dependent enzyme [Thermoleophilia bacterium]